MSVHTVRFDDDSEQVLKTIRQETGMTISEVLKSGLKMLGASLPTKTLTPYEIYQQIDIKSFNPHAPVARKARQNITMLIQQKHTQKKRI